MGFAEDYEWQQRFAPTIRRLVGPHLLVPADFEADCTEATDFALVFKVRHADFRLAARIRRPDVTQHWQRNGGKPDITIRSRRDSGAVTEWSKIRSGWGDWMFYGVATGIGVEVYPWFLMDLHVLRTMHDRLGDGIFDTMDKPNGDGTYFHIVRPGYLHRKHGGLVVAWEYEERSDQQTLEFLISGRRSA